MATQSSLAVRQAKAAEAAAKSNQQIMDALTRIEEKIDRLLASTPAQKPETAMPRKEKA